MRSISSKKYKSIIDFEAENNSKIFDEIWFYVRIRAGLFIKGNLTQENTKVRKKLNFFASLKKVLKFLAKNVFDFRILTSFYCSYDEIYFTDTSQYKIFKKGRKDRLFGHIKDCNKNKKKLTLVRSNPDSLADLSSRKNDKSYNDFNIRLAIRLLSVFVYPFIKRKVINSLIEYGMHKKIYIKYVSYCLAEKSVYRCLFKLWKPKCIYVSCHYIYQGLIVEAKRQKIKIIEAQHGVITDDHFGYYSVLTPTYNFFPDVLLSFGEIEKTNLLIKKVVQVGSSYIEEIKDTSIVKTSFSTINYEKVLGLTLQTAGWEEQAMFNWIEKFSSIYSNFLFVIIPRNVEQISKLPKRANIVFDLRYDFYQLIRHCDIHITLYSSCALEAPSFGVPNILIDVNNFATAYYSKLLQELHTEVISEHEDPIEKINLLSKLNKSMILKNNQKVIKENYYKNIEKFIYHEN